MSLIETLITDLRKDLISLGNEQNREKAQYFFREPIKCYGLKAADMHAITKSYIKKLKGTSKDVHVALSEELFRSGIFEESIAAAEIIFSQRRHFVADDILLFEQWIHLYISNWATCDSFCNHTVGSFLESFPMFVARLKDWARSDNRWLRRAAAVSLIVPARKGKFTEEILEIADCLLQDKDDMVQKGYGWMLKVCSQKNPQTVFDYVMHHKDKMPRTALRYAIEKLPSDLKALAMIKP